MSNQNFDQLTAYKFTAKTMKIAKQHIAKYPKGRQASAVMPLLDLAQRENGGWLPRAAMDYISDLLKMPKIAVYEVATFYTMYNLKPVGKFHVQVCTNLPCLLRGSDKIVNVAKNFLKISIGETTEDNLFTLTEVECLGACVNAPMMQINDDYYEDLDSDSTSAVLEKLKAGDTPKPGSQTGRHTSEPAGGLTSLKNLEGGS
ncbi:MAG TPA: NADH-quinone oxidoreductase subunit NuoE [Rhodospirillales bacterium]|nr:NADH-quinone oxidoreductase subunit NuoE [Rhodospirillales bacterium]